MWTKQCKMALSGGLTALALVFALLALSPACSLAALAMAVSSVGDGLLAGYPGCFAHIKNRLTKGGLVFFAAHVLYILALLSASGQDAVSFLPRFAPPFALFLGLTVLHGAVFYVSARSPVPRAFFAAAFSYLLAVGVHAAAAFAVFDLLGGASILNAAGALLFYASDFILLARKYGSFPEKHVDFLIWATYVPAQLCILLGFFLTK